jgi:MoxR-like ATPase
LEQDVARLHKAMGVLQDNIEQVVVGKRRVVELAVTALLCDGHILIEDVPGIGKTMLARSISRSLGCTFRRVQSTPDLLPSDLTGTYIYNQRLGDFEFRPGPVFAQVLLADEVNRATPRTQSALLEAMEERQVTVEGDTKPLPRPFLVLATQNPVELEGTFPLPEAQLDRFLLRLRMGYPTKEEDREILERFNAGNPIEELKPVVTGEELVELQKTVRGVSVQDDLRTYIIDLVHATRQHPEVELGASPRAMLGLHRASQALAAIRGRTFVMPDDIKYLAPFVLEHRVIPRSASNLRGQSTAQILADVVNRVPVPVEQVGAKG